jgi:hypothetical protein
MEAPPLERKLVAVLAADVASYSRLMEIDEERTLATLSTFRLVTDGLIFAARGKNLRDRRRQHSCRFRQRFGCSPYAVGIQNELARSSNDFEKDRGCSFGSESMSATSC